MSEASTVPAVLDEPRELRPSQDVVATRAAKEVEAAMIVARRFPRDEFAAIAKIQQSCKRQGLAEAAEYEYSRGGTKITGATIDLLRCIKCAWGNITSGWQEISRTFGSSTVYAYAWDLETNARAEMTFEVKHVRDTKGGGKTLTEERDIYELVANQAARRERKCLEGVIPTDVVDEAVSACRVTLKGDGKVSITDRTRGMVSAMAEFNVSVAMIEKRLNHKLEAISENELAGLRRVWKSLKDGVGKREDFFEADAAPAGPGTDDSGKSKSEKVADELAGKMAKGKEKSKPKDKPAETAAPAVKPGDWVEHFKVRIADAFQQEGLLREAALNRVFKEVEAPDNDALTSEDIEFLREFAREQRAESEMPK